MVKESSRTAFIRVPRPELLEKVKDFLLDNLPYKDIVPASGLDFPGFGVPDLLFRSGDKTRLAVVRIDDGRDREGFTLGSIACYFWLKRCLSISGTIFDINCEPEMYIFSHRFSPAARCLVSGLRKSAKVHLLSYNLLRVNGLTEPVIDFHDETYADSARREPEPVRDEQESPEYEKETAAHPSVPGITPEELREFNRLKEVYLPSF